MLMGKNSELGAVSELELLEHTGYMVLDRVFRQAEFQRDFLVTPPRSNLLDHREFTHGKIRSGARPQHRGRR